MALSDNLIRWFNCEDNVATTVVVDSTTTSNATSARNTNLITFNPGRIGLGLDFVPASSDVITDNSDPDFSGTNNFSISLWIYSDSNADCAYFWYSPDNGTTVIMMQQFTDNKVYLQRGGAYVTATIATGAWTHWVMTYDGSNIRAYKNGSETGDSPKATTTSLSSSTKILQFGRRNTTGTLFFNGQIDLIGVWTRAITTTEITTLYNSGNGKAYPFSNAFTTAPTETITISNPITKSYNSVNTINQTVTTSDPVTKITAFAKTQSDTVTISDFNSNSSITTRIISDTINISDPVENSVSIFKTIAETITASDAYINSTNYVKTIADQLSVYDMYSDFKGIIILIYETISTFVTANLTWATSSTITEQVGITTTDTGYITYVKEILELLGITDIASVVRTHSDSLSETIPVNDLTIVSSIFNEITTDTATVSDITSVLKVQFVDILETVNISDVLASTLVYSVLIIESLHLNDPISFPARWNYKVKHTNTWTFKTKSI